MQYLAKHFVRINGTMYVPGEIIEGDAFVSEESLARLLEHGAVEMFGNAELPPILSETDAQEETAAETVQTADAAEEPEEIEEAAPIEIDAMDGVVNAKSKKKTGRGKKK